MWGQQKTVAMVPFAEADRANSYTKANTRKLSHASQFQTGFHGRKSVCAAANTYTLSPQHPRDGEHLMEWCTVTTRWSACLLMLEGTRDVAS
jgi:hypothetical protein